ncbi:MAG: sugar phosphate isomerase/epimerase [Lentisphaerae bacterium]|nr:sugar phosphate isomerase/epimerase [Lentisphaerota bacterium]
MKTTQIAAQLYTLRDHLKTPADIAASLKKVRQIGYRAVQVSGLGPIEESELNRILQGEGLTCCATHESGAKILDETAAVIARLQKLNCRYTAYPYPAGVDFGSLPTVLDLAARLDKAGQLMREAGLVLTYHNHAMEFQRLEGKLVLDWLYEKTDARHLQGEIDTYWVQHGGSDPVAWCRKLKGRLPLLHLKDYTVIGGKPAFAPVGQGNLDIPAIVNAAEASGCEWFIVEQDDCYGADPFEALAHSYRYLSTLVRN